LQIAIICQEEFGGRFQRVALNFSVFLGTGIASMSYFHRFTDGEWVRFGFVFGFNFDRGRERGGVEKRLVSGMVTHYHQ
jgi:hypothetical protein